MAGKTGGISMDPCTVLWKMGKPKKPGSLWRLLHFPALLGFAVSRRDAVGESTGGHVPPGTGVRAVQNFQAVQNFHTAGKCMQAGRCITNTHVPLGRERQLPLRWD